MRKCANNVKKRDDGFGEQRVEINMKKTSIPGEDAEQNSILIYNSGSDRRLKT